MMLMPAAGFCADLKGDVFAQVGAYAETGQDSVTAVIVGGGAGYSVLPKVELFAEFNYVPVANQSFSGGFRASGNLVQAGGGLRIYLNSGGIVRAFVPIVGGYMRATATVPSFFGGELTVSGSGKYAGAGFGAEIGSKRFGARPEVRYIRELVSNGKDGNAITAMCGFYFRF